MSDLNTTSGICLIAKQDPCFIQKTVTEVEMPHLSVSSNIITSPTIKGMCIEEDAKCFEKIFVDYDKVDEDIYSSSNLSRMNVRSVLVEDMTENGSSEHLKPSSQEVLGSVGNTLKGNVGGQKFSIPVSTYLHETSKPVMNDSSFLAEPCYSGETSADKIPSKVLNDQRTYFSQEFDAGFLQVDSTRHNDSIDENQDLRRPFEQVTEQDEKLTTMTSPMQAKSSQIEETVNKDLFEDNKSSFSVASIGINSNRLGNIEGASYDVKRENRDISITGNESNVVNNQQSVQKPVVFTVEEPIIDGTTSARSSFAHLIHEESNCLGVASLLGPTITSGHIPYSGNLSHRSDSSTTSTHSFAFPILQSEWNSSPIKMAKADRRHLRKHRWKTILICCKF